MPVPKNASVHRHPHQVLPDLQFAELPLFGYTQAGVADNVARVRGVEALVVGQFRNDHCSLRWFTNQRIGNPAFTRQHPLNRQTQVVEWLIIQVMSIASCRQQPYIYTQPIPRLANFNGSPFSFDSMHPRYLTNSV